MSKPNPRIYKLIFLFCYCVYWLAIKINVVIWNIKVYIREDYAISKLYKLPIEQDLVKD